MQAMIADVDEDGNGKLYHLIHEQEDKIMV